MEDNRHGPVDIRFQSDFQKRLARHNFNWPSFLKWWFAFSLIIMVNYVSSHTIMVLDKNEIEAQPPIGYPSIHGHCSRGSIGPRNRPHPR